MQVAIRGVVYKDATNNVVGWLNGGRRLGFGRFGKGEKGIKQ